MSMIQMLLGAAGKAGIEATGGTVTTHGSYKVHTFLSSGNFVVTSAGTIDVLVVGGGGAGGSGNAGSYEAGGGGAGGVRTFTSQSVGVGTWAVTVGAGGVSDGDNFANNIGGYSQLALSSNLRSEGGGAGGFDLNPGSGYGASGGGCRRSGTAGGNNYVAAAYYQGQAGYTPTSVPAQGNAGGAGHSAGGDSGGGGGGGAGGAGAAGGTNSGGAGGIGVQNDYRTGSNVYYGGGGGGTGWSSGGAAGGNGGGGAGGQTGTDATANTGGGGGAGDATGSADNGGDGGSGIVVIRYAV